jgi:pimeloyl-ACP methyl ester carboxylesterase
VSWAALRAHEPFGALDLDPRIRVVGVPIGVGALTGLHVVPRGEPRGSVLLVPGYTGSKEDFRLLLPLLAERGWEALAYSQRGQADSAAPAGVEEYALDAVAADAAEVAALAGHPVHLLGHSLGGVVARAAAITAPTVFASVTLLCSGPHGWPERHRDTERIARTSGSGAIWDRDNPHTIGRPDGELTPDDAFLRMRQRATADDNIVAGARILRDEHDTTPELRATGLPVLVAHGVWDAAWPIPWQRAMARDLGARYAVIPDAHHSPNLENPPATAALLDEFWSAG